MGRTRHGASPEAAYDEPDGTSQPDWCPTAANAAAAAAAAGPHKHGPTAARPWRCPWTWCPRKHWRKHPTGRPAGPAPHTALPKLPPSAAAGPQHPSLQPSAHGCLHQAKGLEVQGRAWSAQWAGWSPRSAWTTRWSCWKYHGRRWPTDEHEFHEWKSARDPHGRRAGRDECQHGCHGSAPTAATDAATEAHAQQLTTTTAAGRGEGNAGPGSTDGQP